MIRPKRLKQSEANKRDAYEVTYHRDKATCQKCRRPGLHVERDHRQNRDPFNTVPSNLQLLCGPFSPEGGCHKWKTEHPREAVAEGWAVPRWADPAEWPARRYFRNRWGVLRAGWALYADDGTVTEITEQEAFRRMGKEA